MTLLYIKVFDQLFIIMRQWNMAFMTLELVFSKEQ